MEKLTLIFTIISAAAAFLIKPPLRWKNNDTNGSDESLNGQNIILALLDNVCEESSHPLVERYAQRFRNLSDDDFKVPDALKNFRLLQSERGLLAKNEIFTEYKSSHLLELAALYQLLYYANDLETFYTAAAWSRQNTNCGLFIDVLYMSLLNRKDTKNIMLPQPYELLPNYFVRKDVIMKASRLLDGNFMDMSDNTIYERDRYILFANYTSEIKGDPDIADLAHLTEDAGINSYYYFNRIQLLSDLIIDSSAEYSAERFYYVMKQLLARYNLERSSNEFIGSQHSCLNFKDSLNYYNPLLIYTNGEDFGYRDIPLSQEEMMTLQNENWSNLKTDFNNMTRRQIIKYFIENTIVGENSYEHVANRILGKNTNKQLSVLDHYLTSLRDPSYWCIWNNILNQIDNALKYSTHYKLNDCYLPGIKILDVECKKLSTYYDEFQLDVTNSLRTSERETHLVQIYQKRLSHKPFVLKLNILSQATFNRKVLLRTYLGTSSLSKPTNLYNNTLMLLDSFKVIIKPGKNKIVRSSDEMLSSAQKLSKNINLATHFTLFDNNELKRFPSQTILPKGTPEGLPFRLVVIFTSINERSAKYSVDYNEEKDSSICSNSLPIDLFYKEKQFYNLPNVYIKDILITHKDTIYKNEYTKPKSYDFYKNDENHKVMSKSGNGLSNTQLSNNIKLNLEENRFFNSNSRNSAPNEENEKFLFAKGKNNNLYQDLPAYKSSENSFSKMYDFQKQYGNNSVTKQLSTHSDNAGKKVRFDLQNPYINVHSYKDLDNEPKNMPPKNKSFLNTNTEEGTRDYRKKFTKSKDQPSIETENYAERKSISRQNVNNYPEKNITQKNMRGIFEYA